jgi:hypothetical protein
MTINEGALKSYLSKREEDGYVEDTNEAGFVERIVYTENGVAKIRPIGEEEKGQEVYQLAENNLEVLRENEVDCINTNHVLFDDYRGEEALVIFQPYADEPLKDSDKWVDTVVNAGDKGLNLDPKLENFGIQTNNAGGEIFYGYRDISDKASVHTPSEEVAKEYGITKTEELKEEAS